MSVKRIDFKHVRSQADFLAVLSLYGLSPEKDGHKEGQYKALCPFHDDHKPSLKVNTERNIFNCFACEAGGNILEFVNEIEGYDNLRKAAIRLAQISGISLTPDGARTAKAKPHSAAKAARPAPEETPAAAQPAQPEKVDGDGIPYNRPLDFTLKNLVTDHPFFEERGITEEDIESFGLGVATRRGIMQGRLVIPIHNAKGQLVAYCGRYPASEIPEGEPKYKLPLGFRKDVEVFNLHRLAGSGCSYLILVESYLSVIRLHRLGRPAVSAMGRSISTYQLDLLNEFREENGTRHIVVMFDGDEPGRAGARTVGVALLDAGLVVEIAPVPDGFKPHQATETDIQPLLPGL